MIRKNVLSLFMAFLFCLSTFSSVQAADLENMTKVVINKLEYHNEELPEITNTGDEILVSELENLNLQRYNKDEYGNVGFTFFKVSAEPSISDEDIIKDINDKLTESSYIEKSTEEFFVDDNGQIFVDLEDGRWVIVETTASEQLVKQKANPVLIQLPVQDVSTGARKDIVHIYPKNIVAGLEEIILKIDEEGRPIPDVDFKLYKGKRDGEFREVTNSEGEPLIYTTDENGQIFIKDLTHGDYFFAEIGKEGLIDDVSLEVNYGTMTDEEMLVGYNALADKYNALYFTINEEGIHKSEALSRFVNYKKTTVQKELVDDENLNSRFRFHITVNGPKNIDEYSKIEITDVLSDDASYIKESLEVYIGDKLLEKDVDYSILYEENSFTMKFNLETLKPSDIIDVYYLVQPNEVAQEITNKVTLTFNNSKDVTTQDRYDNDEVVIKTYGRNFKKTDSGLLKTPLKGAEFVVSSNKENAEVFMYLTQDGTWSENIEDARVYTSREDGKFSVQGLKEGNYFLEEIKAPEGYNKLEEKIAFSLGEDSLDKPETIIENTKIEIGTTEEIPLTGGLQVLGLVTVTAFLSFFGYKMYNKEEDKEEK